VPKRGAKRAAILSAANRMLARGGSFSLDEVLKDAGAGVGTFYHHFPNGRDDLLRAAEAAAGEVYEASIVRVLQRNRDAETGVKALVHHCARWAAENPEVARRLPARPGPDLVRATRAWARSVGLASVSGEELLAFTLAPVGVASGADRLAVAAWAAVDALTRA
jgi:AcrR family transcriptional regulator